MKTDESVTRFWLNFTSIFTNFTYTPQDICLDFSDHKYEMKGRSEGKEVKEEQKIYLFQN